MGAALLLVTGVLTVITTLPAAALVCASGVPGDVNGDGFAEVVVGEPGNSNNRGAVHVFYGQEAGLALNATGSALDDQVFTQNTEGVPGAAEAGDRFGWASVLGDFNADGCADLAVSAPGENTFTGTLAVLKGSPSGIVTTGAQSFSIGSLFDPAESSESQRFGAALSVGDLDDDGVDDLAIGAPEKQFGDDVAAGAAVVVFGDASGLNGGTTPATLLTQATEDVPGSPEEFDFFGFALAIGDFDEDGAGELAVGVPGENNGRGTVQTLEGGAGGFGPIATVSVNQDTPGVPDNAEAGDGFGAALAAGDVNGDGEADLAAGAPGENGTRDGLFNGAGAVTLVLGSAGGLTGAGSQHWNQNSPGVEGVAGGEDDFGSALAMGPLDNGPLADLAIGAPGDNIGSITGAGSATVLLGSSSGLTTDDAGGERFHQDIDGIAGAVERYDAFGFSVAAAFVQNPAQASLVIGAPNETVTGDTAGQVHQLSTIEFGPNPFGSRTFHLNSPGVKGTPADNDNFGFTVG
jgi:hypothetical protein